MARADRVDEPVSVTLAGAVDFEGFRRACRSLWAAQVGPERVAWHTADDAEADLFEASSARPEAVEAAATPGIAPLNVPPAFVPLSQSVVLHRDAARFGLLYRLLWRLQREPGLRHDALDADWVLAGQMAQAVRREMHKMTAFVRFRTIAEEGAAEAPLHVAWFEPEHHVVEATAPFFARRFANLRWAILTPERSVRWDGRQLAFGPGGRRDEAPPADAGEKLWLTYYENIFNPARLKLKMMQKEMPKRYWANLPEAQLIDSLAAGAAERSMTMIQRGPGDPPRRRPTRPQPTPGHAETPGGDAPPTLPTLREALDRCRECPIGEHATQAVPGEGLKHARLMFVGEQPGDQEDLQGRPFVGPAGQLFNRALVELGIPRDKVYVTNAVKHFKFELRGTRRIHKTPAQQEAAACLHWLESEIELIEPKALVALGATAARQLMGSPVAVTRLRGQWLTRADGRRVLITLHPSALLRMEPADKAAAYAAWLADLRRALDPPGAGGP
jgi:DNA polymerase